MLSYLASESEGSLKVQGWSASGGRAEVVSDAEGTGGKAVKLTKEAGKKQLGAGVRRGQRCGSVTERGADSLPL